MPERFDFGKHSFDVTWKGFNPGNENLFPAETKIHRAITGPLNPEAVLKVGELYLRRWIWVSDESFVLGPQAQVGRGQIYYDASLGEGFYELADITKSLQGVTKLISKDERVEWVLGYTWIPRAVSRFGFKVSERKFSSPRYSSDVKGMIEKHISRLTKLGRDEQAARLAKRLNSHLDRFGILELKLAYISRTELIRLYPS